MARIIPVDTFDCVVFGATGDLTLRKLLPALYHRFRDGQAPEGSRIIAAARSEMDDSNYRTRAEAALQRHVAKDELDPEQVRRFLACLHYAQVDGAAEKGWEGLLSLLAESPPDRIRVFYLATSPDLYGPICRNLAAHGAITPQSRVVLEKPIGHDLASARAINDEVGSVFAEPQIFRIDHYLGKETVQNLLALRFANTIFERLWNADVIDHVQITVGETVGVEGRGGYYDRSGALRDMVQNHMLQLLCLLAMESPVTFGADSLRDEKLKVLRSLKPMAPHEVEQLTVRGQYIRGAVDGRPVEGYLADLGAEEPSRTETFVALKAELNSRRWANVPFYLRTGKRLPQKVSEIVVQFRALPFTIFPADAGTLQPNALIIRLQPEEGMRLEMMTKEPGPGGLHLRQTGLDISFEKAFGTRYPDAYERLLMDTVRGSTVLFMRRDEVEAAWGWIEPILDAWEAKGDTPRPYSAGSWGPTASIALIERDGRTWHEDLG
ncbi:glucose-6-phosphate dehydrogenase [Roseomonas sp. NAR14]|uniref:Glucose-6-phosphate 1-dehydrogenase n=1 Tax=Roseomonas acroporae TaxID=2937791 RepID=A0A9X1Y5F7_9PROT|nr:glucose-6-phosphate dehydrogenase [Roseomonas acroporae]MCK8783653.1 glucose-6-phosphate dehydrogenase [Roseomonas acroporae]